MKKKNAVRIICVLLSIACLCGCAVHGDTVSTGGQTMPQTEPSQSTTIPIVPLKPTLPVPPTSDATEPAETTIVTKNADELSALVTGGKLKCGDVVCIAEPMEIKEATVFTVPVTLRIEGTLHCSAPILFETYDDGLIAVDLADDILADMLDIRFDTPNCDVVWRGKVPYSSRELAAFNNVRTFNGTDLCGKYGLGGKGTKKIVSFNTETEDLSWDVEGNVLSLSVSYLVSDKLLENASVSIATDDGSVIKENMDLTAGERRYTLTDAAGEKRTYLIRTERITYDLPVFYIEIENDQEVTSREEYLNATLRIDTDTAKGDFPALKTTDILIRGRGHYSWKFDKKSCKIRFDKKTSVMGMAASKNWTLISNYTDRSLLQNHVALEMGKVMDNICYHSSQYPVDVFINGVYRGVYTFGEQLEAKAERIDLEQDSVEIDTDYLLEVGGYDDGDVLNKDYFHAHTLHYVSVKHPDTDVLTEAQMRYLSDYVKKADKAVCTLTNYEDYIDVDSLIDWVIIHELTYNLDSCFRRSCYLVKEKGGKLKMGPLWDFDLAFGSFYRYEAGDWATIGEDGGYVGVTWMNYLKEDAAFMERFTQRWNEVKEKLLNKALTAVDEMGTRVAPSAKMNFEVWDTLGKSVPSQPSSHKKYDTYEKMVGRLRSFIQTRYQWLDEQLNG